MKTSAKLCGAAAALLIAFGASAADKVVPYVQSSSGQIVVNSTDLCWRTGFWTPALAEALGVEGAGCQCDADILDKQACTAEAPAPAQQAEKVTFSADMLFNFNSAQLKAEGQAILDDLVSRIAGVDLEVILSTGYADRIGSESYNQALSEKRADAVKAYLVNKGVDAALIKAEGKGEADPVVNCPDPSANGQVKNFRQLVDCLQPNRRAVVEVIGARPAN
ncbi:OmpA family protein [Sutterella sp.]|uniref:OmpA family protein n=1 Tax=Sutterella sp. TaxID=1981025 RepID=UPI0026DF9D2F|nr:OmpA family protein [Sutterella sp.]MDO5530594.1 OmpA family protein [Sutterella sp.]